MSDQILRSILDQFNDRLIPDSEAAARAFPLLKGRVSNEVLIWLSGEIEGYAVAEDFLTSLPQHLRTYRLVYADELKMTVDDIVQADIKWPPRANRLLFLSLPLSEIEARINSGTDEFAAPAGETPPDLPRNVQTVGIFQKSQLQRIAARFRQEFSTLLCDVLELD